MKTSALPSIAYFTTLTMRILSHPSSCQAGSQLVRRVSLLCGVFILALLPSQTYAQQVNPTTPSSVLVVILRPQGFQPNQLEVPAGRVFFSVHNRSGLPSLSLQLDREAGARLKAVDLRRSKLAWRETVELAPGSYVLSVPGVPKWVCRITVTPNSGGAR